jgi:hypothetical protein
VASVAPQLQLSAISYRRFDDLRFAPDSTALSGLVPAERRHRGSGPPSRPACLSNLMAAIASFLTPRRQVAPHRRRARVIDGNLPPQAGADE